MQHLFSVISSDQNLCKTAIPTGDSFILDGKTNLHRGTARTVAVSDLYELNTLLDNLSPCEAPTLGIHSPVVGAQAPIVTLNSLASAAPGSIARSHDFLKNYPCPGIMLYDIDDHWLQYAPDHLKNATGEDLANILVRELKIEHYLLRASSSSRVFLPDQPRKSHGWHVYTLVTDASLVPLMMKRQFQELFLRGYGWIALSNSTKGPPSKLARSIIDIAVSAPERLIYESAPNAIPPVQVTPRAEYEVVGSLSYVSAVPPDRSTEYDTLLAKLKADIEPLHAALSTQILANYQQSEVDRLKPSTPEDERQLRDRVKRDYSLADRRIASGFLQIHLDSGYTVSVSEILETDYTARVKNNPTVYHGQTCADPFEPDYGGSPGSISKGKARIHTDSNPNIHSFAHGGRSINLRIGPNDLYTLMERAQVAKLPAEQIYNLLLYLWPVTLLERADELSLTQRLIGLFQTRDEKARIREVIRLAKQNPIRDLSDVPEEYTDLVEVDPEPSRLAVYLAERYGDRILYIHGGTWGKFEDRWRVGRDDTDVSKIITPAQDALAEIHPKKRTIILANKFRADTLVYMRQNVHGRDVKFDVDRHLMQTPSFVVDFKEKATRTKSPRDYLLLYAGYDPIEGPTPIYDRFMDNFSQNDPCRRLDLEYCMARTLYPGLGKHFLCLVGEPNSGKSVFSWILQQIFGTYFTILQPEFFVQNSGSRIPEERLTVSLKDKRMGISAEIKYDGYLEIELVKRVTGGDPVGSRRLYSEIEPIYPDISLMMVGNYHPRLKSVDKAFAGRVVEIYQTNTYVEPNGRVPDPLKNEYPAIENIRAKLIKEMPHIFYKILNISYALADQVFHSPYDFQIDITDINTTDPFVMWMNENVEVVPQRSRDPIVDFADFTTIRASFRTYLTISGHRGYTPTDKDIATKLTSYGVIPLDDHDRIQFPNGEIRPCIGQSKVYYDGKTHTVRKNIRLIHAHAGTSDVQPAAHP